MATRTIVRMCSKRRRLLGVVFLVLFLLCVLNYRSSNKSPHDHSDIQRDLPTAPFTFQPEASHEPLPVLGMSSLSKVLAAVITCGCDLEKMKVISNTWRYDVSHMLFAVPYGCKRRQSVRNTVTETYHFHAKDLPKSVQIMKTLQYMQKYHANSYNWFVVVPSETYVNGKKLGLYLSKLNPEEPVYLGQLPVNQSEERLRRVPHERSCVGGPGIVLSRAAMSTVLGHHQADIIQSLQQHLHHHDQPDMDKLFYEDIQQLFMNPDQLWSKDQYSGLLTVYPATLPNHMVTLHLLYRTLEYEQLRTRMATVGNTINNLQSYLKPTGVNPGHMIHYRNYYNASQTNPKRFTGSNLPSWALYQDGSLFNDRTYEPRLSLRHDRMEDTKEIDLLTPWIEKAASKDHGSWLKMTRIEYHYVLRHGLKGNEYIIDALFEPLNSKTVIKRRVRFLRPLAKEIIVKPSKSIDNETVHFVIPLGNVSERFQHFLDFYIKEFLTTHENVHLVLAVYGEKDVTFTRELVEKIRSQYLDSKVTVVPGTGAFSRARAFEVGMTALNKNDLAFLCDVDLNVERAFLQRCRRSAVQGKMVYFPEMFKLYNMKYVYRNRKPPKTFPLNRKHGFWEYYSYGMACMYKSDYSTMDQSLVGWGGEDVDFIVKTLKKKLEVFRAPDTSLVHRWHDNPCKTRNADSHWHCVFSMMRTYADRNDLTAYMLELEKKLADRDKF